MWWYQLLGICLCWMHANGAGWLFGCGVFLCVVFAVYILDRMTGQFIILYYSHLLPLGSWRLLIPDLAFAGSLQIPAELSNHIMPPLLLHCCLPSWVAGRPAAATLQPPSSKGKEKGRARTKKKKRSRLGKPRHMVALFFLISQHPYKSLATHFWVWTPQFEKRCSKLSIIAIISVTSNSSRL